MPGISYSTAISIFHNANPNASANTIVVRGPNASVAFEDTTLADPEGRCRIRQSGGIFAVEEAETTEWGSVFTLLGIDCDTHRVTLGGLVIQSIETGITASTTQTQGQQPLTSTLNIISTVAVANDTVTLPSAEAGLRVIIVNDGANTLQIFPALGDNAGGGLNIAITLAAASVVKLLSIDTTTWIEEPGSSVAGGVHDQAHNHSNALDGTALSPASLNVPASTTLTTPTLTTPTIVATEFTNANHAHAGASSGGQVAATALSSGAATDGQAAKANGAGAVAFEDDVLLANFVIDGGGSAITTGVKGDIVDLPAGVITRVSLLADQTGSIVIDLWKDSWVNAPPTVADTITASAKPTLSAAAASQDSTLTGWTTTIASGDVIRVNVDSAETLTRVTLAIRGRKT